VQVDLSGSSQRPAGRVIADGDILAGHRRRRIQLDRVLAAASAAVTDVDMPDGALACVPLAINRFNVVVDQHAAQAGNLHVILIRDVGRHLEEIDVRIVEQVAARECSVNHRQILPGADLGTTGIGLVLRAGQRVAAVGVNTVLERDRSHAGHIMDECPDPEIAVGLVLLVSVLRSEID